MFDFFQGRFPQGLQRLDKALPLARASGDEVLLLDVLMSQATIVATQGDFERSVPLLERAAERSVTLQRPRYVAGSRVSLALLHGFQGDFNRAASMFEELIGARASGGGVNLPESMVTAATPVPIGPLPSRAGP